MARLLELPLIVPWIRLDRDAKAEEEAALRFAKQPWLAGFCLFGGEAESVRRLTTRLRDAAGRPIFVASDMERGAGQQVRGLRVLPDAGVWGLAATPDEAQAFGAVTAFDARSVGVDVLFAPVLDVRSEPRNPIVGNRSFGWDPDRVGVLGAAYVAGALSFGCAPTAKHYPGHGATTADSHDAVPHVAADRAAMEARDLAPFAAAIAAGCPAVMTAHVAYPSLDRTGVIATFSQTILERLRGMARAAELEPIVFTDALLMTGAATAGGETEAARASISAGCDALLIPTDPERLAAEILDVANPSAHFLGALDRSASRLRSFSTWLGSIPVAPRSALEMLEDVAGKVADRALKLAGGNALDPLDPEEGLLVIVDDDGTADRGQVLVDAAADVGAQPIVVRLRDGKPDAAVPANARPAAIVLMASVRAWKGTSSASVAAQDLVRSLASRSEGRCQVVCLTPRAHDFGTIHVPGAGPDVEQALADRFYG